MKQLTTKMQKNSMWKAESYSQTLSPVMPQQRENRRRYSIQSDIKMILEKNCKVTNVIKFLKKNIEKI